MGIGMVIVVSKNDVDKSVRGIKAERHKGVRHTRALLRGTVR